MWVRLTVGAIAIASVVGCSAGVATTTTVAQSGQPNGLQTLAGSYGLLSIDDHSLPYTAPSKDAVIVPTLFWDGGGETALKASGDTLLLNRDRLIFRYLKRH